MLINSIDYQTDHPYDANKYQTFNGKSLVSPYNTERSKQSIYMNKNDSMSVQSMVVNYKIN